MASFKDVNGKERTVTLSIGALRRFEKKTGKKLIRTISSVVGSADDKEGAESKLLETFGELLEDFDTLATLAYECCVPRSEQGETSLDDFADAIAGPALGTCAVAIIEALTECMSALPNAAALAGTDGSDPK